MKKTIMSVVMMVALLSCTKDSGIIEIKNNSRPEDKCGVILSSDKINYNTVSLKVNFQYGVDVIVLNESDVNAYVVGDTYCK